MIKQIAIPERVRQGVHPLQCAYKPAEIWGADFETVLGKPYTFQCHTGDRDYFEYLERPTDGLWAFLDIVQARKATDVRCYWWNLSFDLPCLLFENLRFFKLQDFVLASQYDGRKLEISVSCGKSWFANLKWGRTKIRLLDAMQFFRCSLDKAAREILKSRKYKHPKGLGEKRLKGPAFERYAARDAKATYKLGQLIEKQHENYNITHTVSASHFASNVFRSKYLKKTIKYPQKLVEKAGILSYHGGLNYVTPDAPAFYRNMVEYDISSAYPEAFCQLPDFTSGRWVRKPGAHGFRRVRWASQCDYKGLRDHAFRPVDRGTAWVTEYEYQSCKECLGGARVLDAWSWTGAGDSPWAKYMYDFYHQKATAPNAVQKEFAKICLNGLSGKLVQNRETNEGQHIAGGLWNPAIASLVTGYTRARLHTLLHAAKGIHAATDSIITRDADLAVYGGLGGLERKEVGDLLLLRNKLYVFFKHGTTKILKWGAHGYWADSETLMRLWRDRKTKYKVNHLWKVREGLARGKTPLLMEETERELKICWEKYLEDPDLVAV